MMERDASVASPSLRAAHYAAPADVGRLRGICLGVGMAGLLAAVLGVLHDPRQFYHSYLIAYLFWLAVTLGCLALCMLHHLSRGDWGLIIRRILESAARTVPLMGLLFIPIVVGMTELYPWSRPEAAADELLRHKAAYLNPSFFIARAAFYFLLWGGLAFVLSRLSREQDETGEPSTFRRMQVWSGPGLVLYALTASFAAIDWLMSLDPKWASSIYGLYFVISQALTALAFVVLVVTYLGRRKPMSEVLQPRHLHDYGKLMLAFVMVWAYFSYSQFLIIWSGNLPEEIPFFLNRTRGGWQAVSLGIILFHFALPFVLLLSRDLKRSGRRLSWIAGLVLAARWLDLYWQIEPAAHPGQFHLSWLDVVLPIGLGGIWMWNFLGLLRDQALVPINDPYIAEALAHE